MNHVETNPPPIASRPVAAAVLVLFVVAAVYALLTPWRRPEGPAPVEDYAAALTAMEASLKPGTRVLVQPPWRDDVLDALEARGLPRGVEATTALALKHGAPTPSVVVLVDDASPLPRSWKKRLADVEAKSFGDVAAYAILADTGALRLDDLLADAAVEVETEDGRTVRCRYAEAKDRHLCPGLPDWMYVGMKPVTSGGEERTCVWAHPTTKGVVRVRWPAMELGRALELSHGLSDAVTRGQGAPVHADVLVGGERIGRATAANRPGFSSRRFPTRSEGPAEVTVEVRTDNDGARHYCFSLASVDDEGAGGAP